MFVRTKSIAYFLALKHILTSLSFAQLFQNMRILTERSIPSTNVHCFWSISCLSNFKNFCKFLELKCVIRTKNNTGNILFARKA